MNAAAMHVLVGIAAAAVFSTLLALFLGIMGDLKRRPKQEPSPWDLEAYGDMPSAHDLDEARERE